MTTQNQTALIALGTFIVGALLGCMFCQFHMRPMMDGADNLNMPVVHDMQDMPTSTMDHGDMGGMMDDMTAGIKGKTGDEFDKAFLAEMIVHHQGAVDMAKLVLTSSKRAEMKKFANDIISAQTKEIETMKKWSDAWFPSPKNFKECAQAGNPIMESFPRQCRSQDGKLFVEDVTSTSSIIDPSDKPVATACVRAGCSGQLCVEKGTEGTMITDCAYRAEYACYNNAKCEPQTSGDCGWTQSAELLSCIKNPPALQ